MRVVQLLVLLASRRRRSKSRHPSDRNPLTTADSRLLRQPAAALTAFKAEDYKVTVMLDYFGVQTPPEIEQHSLNVSKGSGPGVRRGRAYDHAIFGGGSLCPLHGCPPRIRAYRGRATTSETPANMKADTVFQRRFLGSLLVPSVAPTPARRG